MVWLSLGVAVVPCCILLGRCLYIIRRDRDHSFDTMTERMKDAVDEMIQADEESRFRWLRISVFSSLSAFVLFMFTAAQHDDDRERLAITYASTFEGLDTRQLDLNGLLPSLDELLDVLSDPAAALSGVAERIANLSSYADFDPSYFAQGVDALEAINMILSVIRLLATWGRKLFALVDLSKATLQNYLGEEGSSDDDDGVVKVHQTMTSVQSMTSLRFISKHAQRFADNHGFESFKSYEDLDRSDSLILTGMELTDDDVDMLSQLITHPNMNARDFDLRGNAGITTEGWSKLAHAIIKRGSLASLRYVASAKAVTSLRSPPLLLRAVLACLVEPSGPRPVTTPVPPKCAASTATRCRSTSSRAPSRWSRSTCPT